MIFKNINAPISLKDIAEVEASLSIKFPAAVRDLYLSTNGGEPEPYVFESESVDTVVSKFLPLRSTAAGNAVNSYEHLVRKQKLVPPRFFPFAVDGGGDYFFVDCSTLDGAVYFYRGDTANSQRLVDQGLGFEQFWSSLKH